MKKNKIGRPPLNRFSFSCSFCGLRKTPQWRYLDNCRVCNACWMRWRKEQQAKEDAIIPAGNTPVTFYLLQARYRVHRIISALEFSAGNSIMKNETDERL
eukprot:Filipodium_phascolosomae@DN2185_c0_g1_i2.p1